MSRGNVSSDQLAASAKLGAGTKLATSDGTFTLGNVPIFSSDGTLTDSLSSLSSGNGTVCYVNGVFAGNMANTIDINGALPDVSVFSLNGSIL